MASSLEQPEDYWWLPSREWVWIPNRETVEALLTFFVYMYIFLVLNIQTQKAVDAFFVQASQWVPWMGGAWKVFSGTRFGTSFLALLGGLQPSWWVATALAMAPNWGVNATAARILEYFRSSFESLLDTARTSPKYSCETERMHYEYPGIPGKLRDALTTASIMLEDVAEMLTMRDWEQTRWFIAVNAGMVGFFRVLFYAVEASI